jgi:hypothetical protein
VLRGKLICEQDRRTMIEWHWSEILGNVQKSFEYVTSISGFKGYYIPGEEACEDCHCAGFK